jgi:hypothetical protein
MSDLVHLPADDSPAAWASRNLPVVVGVMVRVVRRPELAFDLATELLAVAALQWDLYPAVESRMTWVLRFAQGLVERALEADCVPYGERMRNRIRPAPRTLTGEELDWLRRLGESPLDLDPEARRVAARLELDAPHPGRLRRVALSPLIRLEAVGERF